MSLPVWRGPPLQYLVWMPGCVYSPPTTASSNAKPAWVNRLTLIIGVPPSTWRETRCSCHPAPPPERKPSSYSCHYVVNTTTITTTTTVAAAAATVAADVATPLHRSPNHTVIHSQSATREEKRGVGVCFSPQLQQQVG